MKANELKVKKLRDLPVEDLKTMQEGLVENYFRLRVKHTLGQLEDPLVLRRMRRGIARAKTLLQERGVAESVRRRRRTGTWVAQDKEKS